jgi:hypothetical protein
MAALAAVCGVMIVLFGLVTTRRAPSDAQFGIEVTSFVGGLVLCFLAVVLARLGRLGRKYDGFAARSDNGLAARSETRADARDDHLPG